MELIRKELIFNAETAPAPSHHASTVLPLPDGRIAAAWFGGTHEKNPDVEIWYSIRDNAGWSKPIMASVKSDTACWNPVLTAGKDGIILFFKRGEGIAFPGWQTFVRRAPYSDPFAFGEEKELVPGDRTGGRGPVRDKPIILSDGAMLAGASHEYDDGTWLAFVERSEDDGHTWQRSDYIPADKKTGLIQPSLWEDEDGVHMFMRSNQGKIYRSDSKDLGRTWCEAYPISMDNNNSGIDMVKLPDGRLALVCNPVGSNWGARTPLSLFVSCDGGKTWEKEMDLATGAGEYSYPAIVLAGDGRLYITFTYQRANICFCEIAY
ncbi:MAG: exo-alpha-sialidase [Clostridia bacterium]|nr:exo-alpha-sialidase [Clostridia bacterium]